MAEVFLDALLDTLKILPLLLAVHFLLEILELFQKPKAGLRRLLNGKFAPLFGGAVGLLPQCGFGVVAANLYAQRKMSLGTLFAVFIATSDEAVALLLSSPDGLKFLIPLLCLKFIYAIIIGYAVNGIVSLKSKKMTVKAFVSSPSNANETKLARCSCGCKSAHSESAESEHSADEAQQKGKMDFKFILHPLLHTATVAAFILAVNLMMGIIIYFVTPERLASFMAAATWWQPFLACFIGLIPNCASSVILTQLMIARTITFGAAFGGLCANAGLGLVILFKSNKNIKQNLLIMAILYALSVAVGCVLTPLIL